MKLRKRYFSLLEILLVFALLTLATAAIGFNIRKVLKEQKILDDCTKVLNTLKTAQELMVILNIDTEVSFKKLQKGYSCSIQAKSPIPDEAKLLVNNQVIFLPELESIFFEDAFQNKSLKEKFNLFFYSKGFIMNQGFLTLKAKEITKTLLLKGYPTPLSFETLEKNAKDYFLKIREQITQIISQIAHETE